MKEKLLSVLKPLYADMMTKITIDKDEDIVPFCMQWGKNFPPEENTGILFVGRATNGWVSYSRDVDVLFGTTPNRIFAIDDQMEWVHRNNNPNYNTNSSAFWRIIKSVSQAVYGTEQWYSKIAWSNLFKISHDSGNPNRQLINDQLDSCKRILQAEIQVLSPRFVVFLTSDWEEKFVTFLNGNQECEWLENYQWSEGNGTNLCIIGNTVIISSHHPQGKKEDAHVKTIVQLIEKYL